MEKEVDGQKIDLKLKSIEDELRSLREEKTSLERKANGEISRLKNEIHVVEAAMKAYEEEQFFSADQSDVTRQIRQLGAEVEEYKKKIDAIESSTRSKTEKLDQKIEELTTVYVTNGKEVLPVLFDDLCLKTRKWRLIEQGVFGALAEKIDHFLAVHDEQVQIRIRYLNVLSRLRTSHTIPEAAVVKMETAQKKKYELSGDPKNTGTNWKLAKLQEIKSTLTEVERMYKS